MPFYNDGYYDQRAYGLGQLSPFLGMGSSLANTMGHGDLAKMLGQANGIMGNINKYFPNGFGNFGNTTPANGTGAAGGGNGGNGGGGFGSPFYHGFAPGFGQGFPFSGGMPGGSGMPFGGYPFMGPGNGNGGGGFGNMFHTLFGMPGRVSGNGGMPGYGGGMPGFF